MKPTKRPPISCAARRMLALVLLMLVPLAPAAAQTAATPAPLPAVTTPYVLVDARTGEVIEERDAARPWYPASTTKLMTLYVALAAVRAGEIDLQSPVVMSARAAAEPPSKMGFKKGTVITLDNALKMLMVKSANDVAVAVAEAVGGSVEAFSNRMNAQARRLGMVATHFVNPHGLPDPRHVSSARDMALLGRALTTDFAEYRAYLNLHAIQIGKTVLKNYNTLVERFRGTTGMKTGYICSSGFNLVASAERNGREMIAVVFGSYNALERAEQAAVLLEKGFRSRALFGGARPQLAGLRSGAEFREPLDMCPYLKARRGAIAAGDSEQPEFKTLPNGMVVIQQGDQVRPTHLGQKIAYGPPIRVYVGGAAGASPAGGLAVADAPVPKARPNPPAALAGASQMTAFVGQANATGAPFPATEGPLTLLPSAPSKAAVPLPRAKPN
ncbi:D-alanyl-D-alanine carboxypeptidase family protein [Faunimonas sp. B44]|uniref:D-alanyl-D-alanine carboxypeptidase family protein n=1 Tax=Faunimonas sp. B44 TaxID=3461493 RepID=UPI004043E100